MRSTRVTRSPGPPSLPDALWLRGVNHIEWLGLPRASPAPAMDSNAVAFKNGTQESMIMNPIRRFALASLCAAFAVAAAVPAAAQDFPNKPVTLICPWPAGGTTDQYMRALAQIASKYLGQSVVVDNKPGAGGTLGAQALATTTKPDGYTLSQIPISVFRFPHM